MTVKQKKKSAKKAKAPIAYKQEEPLDAEEYAFSLPQENIDTTHPFLWQRTAAYIIDVLIIYFSLFQIFMYIYVGKTGIPTAGSVQELHAYMISSPSVYSKMLIALFALLVILWTYFSVSEILIGTTFGKGLFSIFVASSNKEKITADQIFLRNLIKSLLFFLLPLDLLGVAFNRNKQRFSEILSNTMVINYNHLSIDYEVQF
ncbi:MAG TPA: RDD family protein [Candidatus Woesearchaeota archaeon]|nr:RDD family protein [Candidatus Woesearchaeota archaeon]